MSHCRLRIAHAHCLQFERSGMVLMSHIREASKVTVNCSYFHPAHQHYTDEAHKAETVPSVVKVYIYIYIYITCFVVVDNKVLNTSIIYNFVCGNTTFTWCFHKQNYIFYRHANLQRTY